MDQQSISLNDAADIFRRRWPVAAAVALIVFLGAVVTAFTLENVYKSTAEIGIDEPDYAVPVPPDVQNVSRESRIYKLNDTVMAHSNILEAIEKFNLFPNDRIDDNPGSVVGLVRQNFELKIKREETEATDRNLGRVIGFSASFYYDNPRTARDVARFFKDKFLLAKRSDRDSEYDRAEEQLRIEVADFEARLSAEEEKLAQFKIRNPGALPEEIQWNRQLIERKSGELGRVETGIRSLESRVADLTNQLSLTPPYVNASADIENRLRELQQRFIQIIGIVTPDHPEYIRLKRQLESLIGAGSNVVLKQMLEAELARALDELNSASYGPEHPERLKLERRIEALQKQIDRLPADSEQTQEPTNPVYISLDLQLRTAQSELRAQRLRRGNLQNEIADLEASVTIAPRVEQELQSILRNIDHLRNQAKVANDRLEAARLSGDRPTGETWRTRANPRMIFEPAFPNRPLYVVLGAFIGLTLGIGAGLIMEAIDSTIRGTRDVRSVMQMPPIAAIPVIKTASDRRRDRLRLASVAGTVVVAVGAVGAYVHFQVNGII